MGETRVDLLHLLEDLRDAYPGSLEATILTEIVANSLDSGASRIEFFADPAQSTLTVVDNGSGMQRKDLTRYHDVAASTKSRGDGIGFAGVGIKLGLLICEDVITETRRASTHIASRWHLATRHKAPWKWISPPPGLVADRGTAVQLKLRNALSPLLDGGFIEATLRHQYEPLLDPAFDAMLQPVYGHEIHFAINSVALERRRTRCADVASVEVRLGRKRKASAFGVMYRDMKGLPEDRRGIAISTYGKVIRRGWDWLGITPMTADLIGGTIEAPELAACLTLNKGDFIRTGTRGAIYLGFRRAIQSVVSRQLSSWGDIRDASEDSRRRLARPIERDLENVLIDLADDFPMLSSLVECRMGGQRKLPIGRAGTSSTARELVASSLTRIDERPADGESADPDGTGHAASGTGTGAVGEEEQESKADRPASAPQTAFPAAAGASRPARYGLAIQFESRADDAELARLLESTVWVNESHPAFRRAAASRSEGYHLAIAVAMALAPLAVPPAEEHGFLTAFLERWGSELDRAGRRKRPRPMLASNS